MNNDTVAHRVFPRLSPIITGRLYWSNLVSQQTSKESHRRLVSGGSGEHVNTNPGGG